MSPLTANKLPKIEKKRRKIRKNRQKRAENSKIGTVLSLTDRAGYATACREKTPNKQKQTKQTRSFIFIEMQSLKSEYFGTLCEDFKSGSSLVI